MRCVSLSLQRRKPSVYIPLGLVLCVAIALLQCAFELFPSAIDRGEVIIGQLTPSLLDLTFHLLPVTFHSVPVLGCSSNWKSVAREPRHIDQVPKNWRRKEAAGNADGTFTMEARRIGGLLPPPRSDPKECQLPMAWSHCVRKLLAAKSS